MAVFIDPDVGVDEMGAETGVQRGDGALPLIVADHLFARRSQTFRTFAWKRERERKKYNLKEFTLKK